MRCNSLVSCELRMPAFGNGTLGMSIGMACALTFVGRLENGRSYRIFAGRLRLAPSRPVAPVMTMRCRSSARPCLTSFPNWRWGFLVVARSRVRCTVVAVSVSTNAICSRGALARDILPGADPYVAMLIRKLQDEVREERRLRSLVRSRRRFEARDLLDSFAEN
jgi:hypothetical protein